MLLLSRIIILVGMKRGRKFSQFQKFPSVIIRYYIISFRENFFAFVYNSLKVEYNQMVFQGRGKIRNDCRNAWIPTVCVTVKRLLQEREREKERGNGADITFVHRL